MLPAGSAGSESAVAGCSQPRRTCCQPELCTGLAAGVRTAPLPRHHLGWPWLVQPLLSVLLWPALCLLPTDVNDNAATFIACLGRPSQMAGFCPPPLRRSSQPLPSQRCRPPSPLPKHTHAAAALRDDARQDRPARGRGGAGQVLRRQARHAGAGAAAVPHAGAGGERRRAGLPPPLLLPTLRVPAPTQAAARRCRQPGLLPPALPGLRWQLQKWEAEGKDYPLAGMPTPSQDEVQRFVDALKAGGVPVLCNKMHLKSEA